MGYVTCILYVKRKFRWIIFLTWVGLFPFSPHPTCNYSWTGLNRRQRKLSKVGLKKLNLVLPIVHGMYLFKNWFLRSRKWLFISILFSISPFIFSRKQNKTKQNKLMRLIRFMLTVSSGFSKCFKMQMVINLSPVSLSNKKVNIYTCPRLTFLKKNATENAYKSISEPLNFKIFWGSMPPHPPPP